MNFADLRRRAAVVRAVPLESVLLFRGAVRDRHDRRKWHSEQGPLSVTGVKFMNWHTGQGGGGAIDLVMHLADVDFRTALAWLEEHLAAGRAAIESSSAHTSERESSLAEGLGRLRLPVRDDRLLGRVRQYLTQRRYLAASLIEPLIASGKLYADCRGNAVFVLLAGRANRPVGAELRGTGPRVWRGMAPGTHKDLGYFWIGAQGSREIVLCESAIDALSCCQTYPQRICISTSGVRADPPWLGGLIVRGFELHCGFDADGPGDAAADQMIALHPAVKRLRPPAHDWNDALGSGR
ncbi:MAG: DUF3991 domain-containing protein [Terriglobia bacterium]